MNINTLGQHAHFLLHLITRIIFDIPACFRAKHRQETELGIKSVSEISCYHIQLLIQYEINH